MEKESAFLGHRRVRVWGLRSGKPISPAREWAFGKVLSKAQQLGLGLGIESEHM